MLIEYLWFFMVGLVVGIIIGNVSFGVRCKNKGFIIISKNDIGPILKFEINQPDEILKLKEVRFEVLVSPDTVVCQQAGDGNEK